MEHFQDERKDVIATTQFANDKLKWRFVLRQVFAVSELWMIHFTLGLFIGSPTVIIPQMRREANSTSVVTDEMASWLSSSSSYTAMVWIFLLPNIARIFGRKKTIIILSLNTILTYLVFYFSTTPTHFLISGILMGTTHASVVTTNVIVISEYSSPKYRGLFLAIKATSFLWGVWVSNTIGTFTHWRYIPVTGFICSLYTLTVFFCPESPYWLASKKRFVECRKAHRWLKGTGDKSEAELEQLLKSCSNDEEQMPTANFKFVTKKEFYMPLFLSILAVVQYNLSGKFVFAIYAIDVIKKIMGSEEAAYRSMLILDGVTILSCNVGCVITKVFNRRTVMITSSSAATIFLYLISLYLYLIKLSTISENIYLSFFLLAGFSISISCGPMIMSTSLCGELIPARFKSVSFIVTAEFFFISYGALLKLSPVMFAAFSMPGTFLFYGLSSSICAILMYIYLPETKDKTLLEIEEYFKDSASVNEGKKLVRPVVN